MSEDCKQRNVRIEELSPRWVEFTGTKGVLRCLKPGESKSRAQGIVFSCPRCKGSKKKEHYCIFLFDSAPAGARPFGRFTYTLSIENGKQVPANFNELSLWMQGQSIRTDWLRPGDLVCKWDGTLQAGIVSWRPSFLERALKK